MQRPRLIALFTGLLAATSGAVPVRGAAGRPITLSERAATRLLISREKPEYPAIARVNYIQGDVYIRVVVSPEGAVRDAHIVQGEPLLAAAALKAVRQWRFHALRDGLKPEEFQTLVHINFTLVAKNPQELPQHPQEDLARAVKPPQLLTSPLASSRKVRLRVLVDRNGKVLDAMGAGGTGRIEAARDVVRGWQFLPARWGTLNVPWYVEVEVPVEGNPDNTEAERAGGV
jgi:TonB family protein